MNKTDKKKSVYAFLSKFILTHMKDEDFNGETLFSFYVYLVFGVLRAKCNTLKEVNKYVSSYLNKNYNVELEVQESEPALYFLEILKENEQVLKLIKIDVFDRIHDIEFKWLLEWVEFCTDYINLTQNIHSEIAVLMTAIDNNFQIDFPFHSILLQYTHERN